jgi:hypothetical protein
VNEGPRPAEDLIRAFRSRTGASGDGITCPPAETIWESAAGALTRQDNEALVDHTAACAACATAWRLARELQEGVFAERRPSLRSVGRRWFPLAAAAALVLTLSGVMVLQIRDRRTEVPAYRVPETRAITSLLSRDHVLPRSSCVLRWASGLADARFNIRVTDEDLNPLASGDGLTTGEFPVPQSALAGLPGGAKILWRLEVLGPDGSRSSSPTFVNIIE